MKSEHRHELKTNELAEWLVNFPQWAKKNLKTIIYVSIVVVLVVAAYIYNRYRKVMVVDKEQQNFTNQMARITPKKARIIRSHSEGVDDSYMLIQNAEQIGRMAQETKNNQMAAMALIEQAQLLRAEPHYRLEPAGKQEVESQLNRAKKIYQQAIQRAGDNRTLASKATFELGLCEEELGNFEKAGQIYSDIVKNTDFESTVAAAQAQRRLDLMDAYKQKIVFKPSDKPKIQPEALELIEIPELKETTELEPEK